MKYKAVIFDLDGTLLNTLDDLADSVNAALERMGLKAHDTDQYRYFVGNGIQNLIKRALPPEKRDDETIKKCLEDMREEYNRRIVEKTRPYEGIPEVLDELQKKGIKMAILSNKPDPETKYVTSKLLSQWKFDAVFGERPGVPRKPDPTSALEIAGLLNIEPSECLYLGDSGSDMETANRAGMTAVGVLWGFRSEKELVSSGANIVLKKPEDLFRYISIF